MAKAKIRKDRKQSELADVIITAWLKAVPDMKGGKVDWPPNADELSAAFNGILDPDDARCVAIPELAPTVTKDNKKIYTIFIPVPYPPFDNKFDLMKYLHDTTKDAYNKDDFGHALIYACGR